MIPRHPATIYPPLFAMLAMLACAFSAPGAPAAAAEFTADFPPGWNLMSFPCQPSSSDPATVFAPFSGDVIGMDDNGTLVSSSELLTAAPGKAYWANFESATGTTISMNCDAVTSPGFTTQLRAGWNLIGSPYSETRWSEATVDGIDVPSSTKITSSLYGYDATSKSYYATNIMEGWGGYAVKADSGGTVAFNPLNTNNPPIAVTEKNRNCIAGVYYKCSNVVMVEDGRTCDDIQYDITCELDGSGSSDGDADALVYSWTQTSGPTVEISSASSSKAMIVPVGNATYTFQIEVTDGLSYSTDTLVVSSKKLSGKLACIVSNFDSTDVFTIDFDDTTGYALTRVTDHGGYELSPHWATDGTKILFTSDRDGDYDIYTINADGTGITNISNDAYNDKYSDWSSAGRIVFNSDKTGFTEVYDMNQSGGDIRQLTTIGKNSWRPEYSFSETQILFETNYGGDNYEIYVMDADGSNQIRLTNDTKIQGHACWSSDDRVTYAEQDAFGLPMTYKVMNSDGSNILEWPKPDSVSEIYTQSMSADGKFIFYSAADSYIHVMLSDGSADASLGLVGYEPDHFAGP